MNETEELHGAASRFSEMKILIIDDELASVGLLEDLLSDNGHTQVKSIMDPARSTHERRHARSHWQLRHGAVPLGRPGPRINLRNYARV
jgi:hypothetical protein